MLERPGIKFQEAGRCNTRLVQHLHDRWICELACLTVPPSPFPVHCRSASAELAWLGGNCLMLQALSRRRGQAAWHISTMIISNMMYLVPSGMPPAQLSCRWAHRPLQQRKQEGHPQSTWSRLLCSAGPTTAGQGGAGSHSTTRTANTGRQFLRRTTLDASHIQEHTAPRCNPCPASV